ncbi:serine protease inhibitor 88Ea-like [Musca vetustissima]|uniref:serine protease inhibitor 88Ea-like n=1 Tax=Musca vetustissima TaxID=27455 RepID=UPI002AB6B85D|nr:serine protease inhibitor 88Ea-like [Musca vetustissima]
MDSENEFLKEFLCCYEMQRCIWDITSPEYLSRDFKMKSFGELLHKLKQKLLERTIFTRRRFGGLSRAKLQWPKNKKHVNNGYRLEKQMRYSCTKKIRLQWAKNKKHVNNGYRLEKQMRYSRTKKMPLEFTAADRIYFDKSINLAAEEGRMEINNWIANVTRNEIPEMLNPCDVTSDSQMVLANAAYFKVQWSDKFDAKDTKQEIFFMCCKNVK